MSPMIERCSPDHETGQKDEHGAEVKNADTKESFDFITKLPLEVLHSIFNYIPIVDALVACYTSPEWNERISMLWFYWKTWAELNVSPHALKTKHDLKSVCGAAVSQVLNFGAQMVNTKQDFSTRIEISAIDYYGGVLLCIGNRAKDLYSLQTIAHIYKHQRGGWTSLTSFAVTPDVYLVSTCCLIPGYKIICGGYDGVLAVWDFQELKRKATFEREIFAHDCKIDTIQGNRELDIILTFASDGGAKLWSLQTGTHLMTIQCTRHAKVSLLTGETCPFIGYNCVLVHQLQTSSFAMFCWGNGIPVQHAIRSTDIKYASKYAGCSRDASYILDNSLVQGGSLIYALEHSIEGHRKSEDLKLIWQPIKANDFLQGDNTILSNEELERFRNSLHPIRIEKSVSLPRKTNRLIAVGHCFSLVTCGKTLKIVSNASGSWETIDDRILPTKTAKFICSEWLNGLDCFHADRIISIVVDKGRSTIVTFSFKREELNKDELLRHLLTAQKKQQR